VVWLIRKLTKSRNNSRILGLTFGSLWTLGWVCLTLLISSVVRDFKATSNTVEEPVTLNNARLNKMVVSSTDPYNKKYYGRNWIKFEPFEDVFDEDTAFVRNIYIEIAKAETDSFKVTVKRLSRGRTRPEASRLASLIDFSVAQKDSVLLLDKGIAINKTDKFRNQTVIVTVYVPVGKQIRINRGIGWQVHFGNNRWDRDFDNWTYEEDMRWQSDVDYVMKADGLYTVDGKKADGWSDDNRNRTKRNYNEDTYRYNYNEYDKKADSLRNIDEMKRQKKLDSIYRQKEKLDSMENSIESGSVINSTIETEILPAVIVPVVPLLVNIN
jgi:hypothetical protein